MVYINLDIWNMPTSASFFRRPLSLNFFGILRNSFSAAFPIVLGTVIFGDVGLIAALFVTQFFVCPDTIIGFMVITDKVHIIRSVMLCPAAYIDINDNDKDCR